MLGPKNNPFRFGGPVNGSYYLQRPGLAKAVTNLLDNKIHVVLVGPRRFGKTSFIANLLKQNAPGDRTGLFVDIFNITSHHDFLQQVLRALRDKTTLRKRIHDWTQNIMRLRPQISLEQEPGSGLPVFSLSAKANHGDIKSLLQDTLEFVDGLGKKVVFAIDEFQAVANLDDRGWLEATLRTHMQRYKNTSLLLSGSRRSVINDMLNNPGRPFYRSCQPLEFPSFGEEFTDWILSRFASVGVKCRREAVAWLRKEVLDTPNYVQMVCFHVVATGLKKVTETEMQQTLKMVVLQNVYAYQTLLNSLTHIQQRALRLAANNPSQVYAKDLLAHHEIPSAQALASAIKSLKDKNILDEGTSRGIVVFDDPLFALWLRYEYGKM